MAKIGEVVEKAVEVTAENAAVDKKVMFDGKKLVGTACSGIAFGVGSLFGYKLASKACDWVVNKHEVRKQKRAEKKAAKEAAKLELIEEVDDEGNVEE